MNIVHLVGVINRLFGNMRIQGMEYCKMICYPYQQMHNIYIYIYIYINNIFNKFSNMFQCIRIIFRAYYTAVLLQKLQKLLTL